MVKDHEIVEILLVEDNPTDTELALRALRKKNLANHLTWVKDGEEALDFLFCQGAYAGREGCQTPRVILLDLRLPKVDGLEVLQKIKADERTKRIPVVVLTTSKEDRDLTAAYDNGANSYIRKPVDFAQFLEAVNQLGVYWLVINEPPPSISR